MRNNWESHDTWISYFDILGFKSSLESADQPPTLERLKKKIDSVISELEKEIEKHDESIDYLFYADTFILFSKNNKIGDYPSLIRASKTFINKCIRERIPIRGAISFGHVQFGYKKKIIIGKAFLDAHVYSEDQDWIGLILTPSATNELNSHELHPVRHGFINKDIPLRKYLDAKELVFAYKFINGSTNFKCPLLTPLKEMRSLAPESVKVKYSNTIEFIKKHYTVHSS